MFADAGPALHPETARRLACDGTIVRIIEADGRPPSVGRRTRTVSPALRRALASRDRGCRFPGCTHARFVDAHHIHHWAHGGPTRLDNLVTLCRRHPRLLHEGGFSVECRPRGRFRFRRPDGRVIAHGPALDAETAVTRWSGERLGLDATTLALLRPV